MYRICWVANRQDGPGRTTGSLGRQMSRTARQKNSGRQAGIRTRDDQGKKGGQRDKQEDHWARDVLNARQLTRGRHGDRLGNGYLPAGQLFQRQAGVGT
jgi:hypothetical protein